MEQISQKELKKMILFSCERIERDKEQINKINVFPVPDQDTGNNLAATLKGIKEAIADKEFASLKDLSDSILDGALTAAQGNTGIIYTGFLAGFLPFISDGETIDSLKLGKAFEKGYERAKDSIQNPKEGTMLDVIKAFASRVSEISGKEKDIVKVFYSGLEKANEALLDTPNKMEILKKAGVVDAGGLGFLMILETYLDALMEQQESFTIKPFDDEESDRPKRFIQILSNRYEVVALLHDGDYTEREIRERLSNLGNCLDVIQVEERTKIHIHTDDPYEVRDIIKGMGEIESLRIEDMTKEVTGEKSIENVSIGIIVDERVGLTPKIIQHYDIEVIPLKINWPEGESVAGENICQRIKEAKKQGIVSKPKIDPISPDFFLESYRKQLEKFQDVICIVSSSRLSDNYKSAFKAREMLNYKEKEHIYLVDSKNISAGQSVLVLEAIEMIREQRNIEEIIRNVERAASKVNLYCILERSDWWNTEKGNHFWWGKPAAETHYVLGEMKNGKIIPAETIKTNGFAQALFNKVEKEIKKDVREGKRIRFVISHGDNQSQAEELRAKLKTVKKTDISFINITDPITSINACPQSLLVGWIAK
jgi:dihydroxyacetone kinase-like predicted kinase